VFVLNLHSFTDAFSDLYRSGKALQLYSRFLGAKGERVIVSFDMPLSASSSVNELESGNLYVSALWEADFIIY
jgi:hypothetical protein